MRRLYRGLLVVTMLAPAAIMSAEEFEYQGMNFYTEDGKVYVGDNASMEGDVVIPATVELNGEELTVSAIADWAFNWSAITSVVIPPTIESIGSQAFSGCQSLTSVEIPASVKRLGQWAFDNTGLVTVTVPATLEEIGDGAFQGNNSLISVTVGGIPKISANMFANCFSLTEVTLSEGTEEIGDYAFSGPTNIASLTIPSTVRRIGDGAFQYASLNKLSIPASVEYIGDWAFAYNNYITMTELRIEDSDTPLETQPYAFFYVPTEKLYMGRDITSPPYIDCMYLKEISTGGGCTYISGFSSGCYELETITFHEGLKTIGEGAFSIIDKVTSLTIPASVTTIEKGAFSIMYGLQTLTFLDGDETLVMGEATFSAVEPVTVYVGRQFDTPYIGFGYGSIEHLTFGGGCKTISGWAQRSALKELVIGEGVERIEDEAFQQADQLVTVKLPSTLTYIGNDAFNYCPNLSEINIPDAVTYIGDSSFSSSALTDIQIPEGLTYLGGWAFAYTKITKVVIPDGLEKIQWCAFLDCKELTDVTIGKGVTFIDTSAFGGLTSLENLTLADSDAPIRLSGMGVFGGSPVKNLQLGRQIHGSWFYHAGLQSVSFTGGCTEIGGWDDSPLLQQLTFGPDVATINSEAFKGCPAITKVDVLGPTPATLADDGFTADVYAAATCTVPGASLDLYKSADGWKNFMNIVPDAVGINGINTDNATGVYTVYTLNGMLLKAGVDTLEIKQLPAGIYIINGKKTLIR